MTATVHIAIPARQELANLPSCLEAICGQDLQKIKVWVCVNHPEHWASDPVHEECITDNLHSLSFLERLRSAFPYPLQIIDKASPGEEMQGKNHGVGMARKQIFDAILSEAADDDIIISLDADTLIPNGYSKSICGLLQNNAKIRGVASPYYHPLTENKTVDRSMLRYEIYMRSYFINMLRIDNPYAFTALGSALAFTAGALRNSGGFSPKTAGEDFYLLQKLRKNGPLAIHIPETVIPGTRYSSRVGFGTGPAMMRGAKGDWASYPIYAPRNFDVIRKVFEAFPEISQQGETEADNFYREQLGIENPWEILRRNHPRKDRFIKACAERFDGLRILQFLRYIQDDSRIHEGKAISTLLNSLEEDISPWLEKTSNLWEQASYDELKELREQLFETEMKMRKQKPVLDGIF